MITAVNPAEAEAGAYFMLALTHKGTLTKTSCHTLSRGITSSRVLRSLALSLSQKLQEAM
jgi:hypothetical protein